MASTPRAPHAQQERSRRTEGRILDAALALLDTHGVEGLTIATVSERARVSVGSVYRRFGSREQLLLSTQSAFTQRFTEQMTGELLAASPAEPEAIIAHATTAMARTFQANARPLHTLLLLGVSDPRVFAEGQRASVEGGREYAAFVLRARDAIRRPDPDAAVDDTYRSIYAICSHRITQGGSLESRQPVGWDRVISELVEMNCAYLLSAPRFPT